ncbi:hypothetical protein [Nocardia blacklockiae]|uniref:hypothetical protein n=1 Tax=Nocardia blacklockiae TaxID=480036 RepID=UPI0018944CE0|nr:hypothetical protein [Nocardia blacklockiae]MBF6170688.1 hypothetical protein [Nocardia blacklockiae]
MLALGGWVTAVPAVAAADGSYIEYTGDLTNNTPFRMVLIGNNLDHGLWSTLPPRELPPGGTVRWASHGTGIMVGTEGYASYRIEQRGLPVQPYAYLHWNLPYVGDNSFDTYTFTHYNLETRFGYGPQGPKVNAYYTISCRYPNCREFG